MSRRYENRDERLHTLFDGIMNGIAIKLKQAIRPE